MLSTVATGGREHRRLWESAQTRLGIRRVNHVPTLMATSHRVLAGGGSGLSTALVNTSSHRSGRGCWRTPSNEKRCQIACPPCDGGPNVLRELPRIRERRLFLQLSGPHETERDAGPAVSTNPDQPARYRIQASAGSGLTAQRKDGFQNRAVEHRRNHIEGLRTTTACETRLAKSAARRRGRGLPAGESRRRFRSCGRPTPGAARRVGAPHRRTASAPRARCTTHRPPRSAAAGPRRRRRITSTGGSRSTATVRTPPGIPSANASTSRTRSTKTGRLCADGQYPASSVRSGQRPTGTRSAPNRSSARRIAAVCRSGGRAISVESPNRASIRRVLGWPSSSAGRCSDQIRRRGLIAREIDGGTASRARRPAGRVRKPRARRHRSSPPALPRRTPPLRARPECLARYPQ